LRGHYFSPFNAKRTAVLVVTVMLMKAMIEEEKKQENKVTILMKREK
jgi:hypothetical protein